LPARLRLSNPERVTLAEIGKRLGRRALREVACIARPDTILAWYRRLVAEKFDGSQHRQYPGRPPVSSKVEALVVRMARENSGWGYDRIVGALANLGHPLSDQTVKNILRRHGIAPAPKRSQVMSWKDFLAAHMNVLAGCDFLAWVGDLLCAVLPPSGKPARAYRGNHQTPGSRMDGTDWSLCHAGDLGLSSSVPLCAARS
jgi:putative transposase